MVKLLLAAGEGLEGRPDSYSSYLKRLKLTAMFSAFDWSSKLRQLVFHHTLCVNDIMAVAAAAPGGTCPPLFAAARRGDLVQLQQLLADGETDSMLDGSTKPDWLDDCDWASTPKSALAAAAKSEQQQCMAALKLLVSAASPEQLAGGYGFAAILAALESGADCETVQQLLDAGVPTALDGHAALPHAASCSFETFKAVLTAVQQRGGSLDEVGAGIGTALQCVVRCGKADFVELLLQQGANVNAVGRDGTTALFEAVYRGGTQLVQMLLAAGADAGAAAPGAVSALAMAARDFETQLVDMLLEHTKPALPASAIVNAAWEAFQDDDGSEWEEEEVLQADECRRLQDSIVSNLLKAAAVRDPVATAAALADCSQQVAELYKEAKQQHDAAAGDPINPDLIQRSSVMLKALSGL